MRIISGRFRGRRLFAPASRHVRPTSDRVREALFSIVGSRVQDASVLDLFAGTGALGLEALSRGAAQAVFVDSHPKSVELIRRNMGACGLDDQSARVLCMPAKAAVERLRKEGRHFQIIFMDPPYGKHLVSDTLPLLMGISLPETLVVAEHTPSEAMARSYHGWSVRDQRRYGDTAITFLVRD
ncbi:16S rRNA (guanine(966)-N(2))-methyltransferase RsmD [Desulfacinum hydrothermale DSM 13146]|uniref:16S rRNA (Guanine(966)-N(2))-methyltransferase RsmD n=1 Tax=Desulfacinum hydrothermale DSM 13146 TaxID=1121390 RepID=A0A1W1XJY6_9BACT|nr:16S rRNA (guanine(966)-N(2))-methyltransferase RsmD [Desulfacinum hydrothermale]SMC24084.1 16S rRNA (guanine(966)-N(2))-methyltransferase RsmD [Desulfacinum hydrothermale DSM 13146]